MNRQFLIATLSVGLFGPHAAFAASHDDRPLSVVVRFADLDVSRDAGAATLYARIRLAAHRVCVPLAGRSLSARARQAACVDKAIANAVAAVAAPHLTDLHQRATGRDSAPKTHVATSR